MTRVRLGGRALRQPLAQQGRHHGDVGGRAPLGQEDPEDRVLQLRRAVQAVDAVVGQHLREPLLEGLRQPGPVRVEELQVGVEVLAGAVHRGVGLGVLAGGPVAAQLAQVGEQAQQLDLAGQLVPALRDELGARGQVGGRAGAARPAGRCRSPSSRLRRSCRPRAARSAAGTFAGSAGRSSSTSLAAAAGPAASSSSPSGSRRSRRAPASTWLPTDTGELPHPGRGTARAAPSPSSCSPAPRAAARRPRPRRPTCSGVATTSAGAGERTTPPSSRLIRCVTPSTSTRWIGPCVLGDEPEADAVHDDLAGVLVEALDARRRPRARRRPPTGRRGTGGRRCGRPGRGSRRRGASAPAGGRSRAATCGRPPCAVARRRCRVTASSSSYASMAAAISAIAECWCGTRRALGADAVDPAGVGGAVDHRGLVEQIGRSSCW